MRGSDTVSGSLFGYVDLEVSIGIQTGPLIGVQK